MSTSGGGKARSGGDDGVGLGALRVVHVAHADTRGDELEAVLDAGEGTHGAADGVRRDAVQEAHGRRRQDIGDAVLAGHGDLLERQDAAVGPGLREAAPGDRQPRHLAVPRSSHRPRRGRRRVELERA